MTRHRPIRIAALVLPLALSACSLPFLQPRVRETATAEEQQLYRQAEAETRRDPEAGRVALQEFLDRYPRGPLADDAAMTLAHLAEEDGDVETAATWLGYVVREHGRGERAEEARIELAKIELDRGRPEEARRLLRRARFTELPPDARLEAFRILADAAEDDVERLYWLASVRESERELGLEADLEETDHAIDALIGGLQRDDLERAASQLGRRIPAARIRLRLAERALEVGDLDEARDQFEEASGLDVAPEYAGLRSEVAQQIALRERIADTGEQLPGFRDVAALPPPATEAARGVIGVVLPLSGPFAAYGEHCLEGILLAAGIFEEVGEGIAIPPPGAEPGAAAPMPSVESPPPSGVESGPRVRLLVRDSAGDPERAVEAVRELADDPSVVAIVGPLLSQTAEAAAQEAQRIGIPLVTLATRDEVAAGRSWVFRTRTTPGDEIQSVLDYAFDTLHARRFAILYPATRYGQGARERFWESVDARGGEVVAVSSYDPQATDFAEPIRRMIGYTLLTGAEQKALKDREQALSRLRRLPPEEAARAREEIMAAPGPEGEPLPPIVDFDALFIPDSYENIVLIAPQLAFHEVTGVRLLGTGDWLHPDLVRIARNHVRGAVIAAPFDPASRFEFVARFVERFTGTFGLEPDVFAAQAFDAANLVLVQLAAGREDRDDVREGLLSVQGYPGAAGVLSFRPDGNARKRPFLLGVRSGEIRSLD